MKTKKNQRDFGLDLARAAAGVLTLCVHFFWNNGFYKTPVSGKAMLASCIIRMACMTCVPLFMLLTGYLCVNRKLEKGYYRKLLPILLTYVLAGAACVVFQFLQGEKFSVRDVVELFTTYSAAPYGWYIEMYIGLFLLSPFLNAAWHALEDSGKKRLVFSLAGLTALPSLVNQAWILLPEFWIGIYPLTYYAVGAWLREHPIREKSRELFLYWVAMAVVLGIKGYLSARGGSYVWMPEDEWWSLMLMLQAVLLFSCLRKCRGERAPVFLRRLVEWVAKLALPMYLVSYIVDQLVYPVLNQAVPQAELRILWMPLVAPVVVLCSLVLAQLVDWVVKALMRLIPTIRKMLKES